MLKIVKQQPDNFDLLIKNKKVWSDLKDKTILNNSLSDEQENMCVYCETKLNKYHIDHFYKRDLFPNKTFDYENLYLSCDNENNCAKHKDKFGLQKYKFESMYNPINIKLEEFKYTSMGDILGQSDEAIYTIKVFNLNSKKLVEQRKRIISGIKDCGNLNIDLFEIFNEFKNLLIHIEEGRV